MSTERLPVLELRGSSSAIGQAHGAAEAHAIASYLADRLSTLSDGSWFGREIAPDLIMECAEESLAHHEQFSKGLYQELEAVAGAARLTNAELLVVGGFTDLVDIVRTRIGNAPVLHQCTAVLSPTRKVLAQTWDMNMSARDYVRVLRIEPDIGPRALVQSTAGCLGQIGINEAGIAVGINNLASLGQPGVTWPFVVRRALQQTSLESAVAVVIDAPLAGGHNFLLMDGDGASVNIEAMPNSKAVTTSTASPIVHTNHCLAGDTSAEEVDQPEDLAEDSHLRYQAAVEHGDDVEAIFSDSRIARRGAQPHEGATCASVVMDSSKKRLRVAWGVPTDHPWVDFTF